jgi:hypothetical protein
VLGAYISRIDQLLAFQEDDIVSQALENEMDLREYAKQIAEEKISVQRDLENNCKFVFRYMYWVD